MYDWVLIPLGFVFGLFLTCALPQIKRTKEQTQRINISIIIPARNEEQNLPLLMADIQRQSFRPYEVICVDDQSEDGTARVVEQLGACVIPAGERPEGWMGKPWACQQGAENATGELLLFLDADIRMSETALASLAAAYQERACAISIQPYHKVKKRYESFSMFFNIILVACTGIGLPFKVKPSGMFGPVFLVDREQYLHLGGHGEVRSRVLEDFFLGKYYKKNHIPYALQLGGTEFSFRMYAGGFKCLWEGWTKNISTGALSIPLPYLVMAFVWVTAAIGVFLGLIIQAICGALPWILFYAGMYVLFTAHLLLLRCKIGSFPILACVFYPVFLAGFILIFICSLFMKLFLHKAVWKGRKIKV